MSVRREQRISLQERLLGFSALYIQVDRWWLYSEEPRRGLGFVEKDHAFSLGHVNFEVPLKHPRVGVKYAAGYSDKWTQDLETAGQIQWCYGADSHWLLKAYCLNIEEYYKLVIKPLVTSKLVMMKVFIARKEVDKCYKVVSPPCPCPSQFIRIAVLKITFGGAQLGLWLNLLGRLYRVHRA